MPGQNRSANVVRTVFWIVVSTAAFLFNTWRVHLAHAAGLRPHTITVVAAIVWLLALLFWLSVAWRDWTRRAA